MTKIERLQADLATKAQATTERVQEAVTVSRLEAKLNMLDNEALINARIRAALVTSTTNKLKEIEMQCEEIINSMPIYSAKTRENRKWNPSRQYGLGNQIALLTGILSGIQYSAAEHKAQMLGLTGLTEDMVEQALEAFGSPSYYSKNYDMVVDSVPYNLDAIHDHIALLEEALDIQLDKSKLTDKVMSTRFAVASARAEQHKAEAETTELLNSQTLKL